MIMKIREIMTPSVQLVAADDTIHDAAEMMAGADCGVLPVFDGDRLVGMITDRDIVTRAVADGLDPDDCFVHEIMTPNVKYCYEDESVQDLARNLASLQVKRVPVLNRDKRLVGIVSLGDMAGDARNEAQWALAGICRNREVRPFPRAL
jgi:CBS domain-containing protein